MGVDRLWGWWLVETQPLLTHLWRPLLGRLFFSLSLPFADVRRGASLLSPSPGTATLAQLREPPLHSDLTLPPSLGSIDQGGLARCAVTLSAAGWSCCPWHTRREGRRIFLCFFSFLAGAGRGVGGRAVRAEGRAAAFPWITSLVSQGRNLRGAAQTN